METWPTVNTPDEIAGSSYLVTHRMWVDWMEQCLSDGREYVISLDEAKKFYPNPPFYSGGSTNTFLSYYKTTKPAAYVLPEKAAFLTNGITFKGVVDTLGPGWRPPGEGIGYSRTNPQFETAYGHSRSCCIEWSLRSHLSGAS